MKWLNCEKMRLALVGFLGAVLLGGVNAKGDFAWKQIDDIPTPRTCATSAVVNGKIYIIGGWTSEPDSIGISTVEEYNPATDTWTKKADMPTARDSSPSSAVVDGKIYVIGGGDPINWHLPTLEEYDLATDTWTQRTDMPTSRWGLATCAVDGKIYAIGGGGDRGNWAGLKVVEQYDPLTDTWTRKASMPTGLWGLCANVVNGKIYAFGGRPERQAGSDTFEYDPTIDTWTRKASIPLGTSEMGSVVLGEKIVVIGGWRWSQVYPYTRVQIYDTKNDIWTREADVPFQRVSFSAEVVRGKIFAIGGTDRPHPCPALSTVYECGPLVDFNHDGIVDAADMCIMVDHWGEDYSLCDIGPTLFGDGVVDVEDLKVLADHLFQEVEDPTLIAHWPMDETEGIIAYDSASVNDAVLVGNAVWQPYSGQINGALQLDGINSYVIADPVLNPADGPCSVFAWINGGAPGQVVLSQADGANWLAVDAEGYLMTELTGPGRSAGPLFSETVITDGQWHRIGLVWDGSKRMLYVDDVVVAEDTQTGLVSSDGGLYIGCGKGMESGTFSSGLIDDVRIYDRVVHP
ncbi:kelch repeat-containing protein [Planctomycetota bacterium]